MANLGFFEIDTDGEYVNLSDITGITFASGKTYLIQIQGSCNLCESATKPTKGGFLINKNEPFSYTSNGTTLWVCTVSSSYINIAE